MVDKEKARGKAEQPKGRAKPAIDEATGSKEIEGNGNVAEPRGRARKNTSDAKSDVRNVASKAKDNNARR